MGFSESGGEGAGVQKGRLELSALNDAVELRAEGIVRGLVREAARGEDADAGRCAIAAARHVVQRAGVLGVQRAHGAVCLDVGFGRMVGSDRAV